jgi:hypothetical protein
VLFHEKGKVVDSERHHSPPEIRVHERKLIPRSLWSRTLKLSAATYRHMMASCKKEIKADRGVAHWWQEARVGERAADDGQQRAKLQKPRIVRVRKCTQICRFASILVAHQHEREELVVDVRMAVTIRKQKPSAQNQSTQPCESPEFTSDI